MTDAYHQAVDRLTERGRFGIRLGLGRTRALLREFGSPEKSLRGVLIGGTNGKGSVQALVAAALREAGYRVGQTPKPHLADYRERIVVDGEPIGEADFAAVVEEVLAAADVVARRLGPPTEFEALTTAAFVWFQRVGVEVGVIEVGLGGRLDATNAWQGGVSAITNVALDHMEHLGPTVEAIAREKAPIIKRGDLAAVTGADGDALKVIRRRARLVGVPLRVVDPLPVIASDRHGLTLRAPLATHETLQIRLLGRHQAANAAVALEIIRAFNGGDEFRVSDDAVSRGFANARWPGRMELLEIDGHDVLFDGAHNPHGAAALAAALDDLRGQLSAGRPTLLIGVVREKDLDGMLAPLRGSKTLHDATVIATNVPGTPRSRDAAAIAAAWGPAARVIEETDAALSAALRTAHEQGGPLVVCGSLYLVGHVRTALVTGS